jgi:hypothetical protein
VCRTPMPEDRSASAVVLRPQAQQTPPAAALTSFPARRVSPAHPRSVSYGSVASPPQINTNSKLSTSHGVVITNLEELVNPDTDHLQRPSPAENPLSPGNRLQVSVLANGALQVDVLHMSGHWVRLLRLSGVAKRPLEVFPQGGIPKLAALRGCSWRDV